MYIARALAVLGPLVTAVGAAFTAYDILRSPLRTVRRRLLEDQAKLLSDAWLRIVAKYRDLPDTHSRKEEWTREGEAKARKEFEDATESWRRFEEEEHEYSFRLVIRGLLLIFLGSVLQSLAAFLAR
jgi:hypothetical protein